MTPTNSFFQIYQLVMRFVLKKVIISLLLFEFCLTCFNIKAFGYTMQAVDTHLKYANKPLESMWNHCKKKFQQSNPEADIHLISEYQAPINELHLNSEHHLSSPDNPDKNPLLVDNSRHSDSVYLKVQLDHSDKINADQSIRSFLNICSRFGFSKQGQIDRSIFVLSFKDIGSSYRQILNSGRIPQPEFGDLISAFHQSSFYPSPDGLRVLLALSEQRSDFTWNPNLSEQKKKILQNQYNHFAKNSQDSFWGLISSWLLPNHFNRQKETFFQQFKSIIKPSNKMVTDFDLYLWTQRVLTSLKDPETGQSAIPYYGEWLFNADTAIRRLNFEPQQFGLWQININHFQNSLLKNLTGPVRNIENNISKLTKNRSALIQSISGILNAPLNKEKTLVLVVEYYLKPRYQMHIQGKEDDLLFFIAENLTGALSTYKAALQNALNDQLGSKLILDGDLVFYKPYSLKIDWKRQSNTQVQLNHFIEKNKRQFDHTFNKEKLIKILCQAETWQELQNSELYQQIMKNRIGQRIYPTTRTNLYHQYPRNYAKKILKHALKYY